MKKTMVFMLVFALMLSMIACGNDGHNNKQFASGDEMLQHLEGMWVVGDNAEEKTYYIFQNGQIYNLTDTMYSAQVENLLDSALQNSGLDALHLQDFATVSDRMYLSDVAVTPDPVSLYPQNGEIKLYEGKYEQKSIIITEDTVLLAPKDSENAAVMTKLSNTVDLSTEHFEALFNQVIDSYQIPASSFLVSTEEYGEMIKSTISGFDWWNLIWTDEEQQLYTPNEALTPINGSKLLITKEDLLYVYKVSVSTGFIGENHEETLTITYSPEEGVFEAIEVNKSLSNVHTLIAYGLYAVQNIPGAYTNPEALYNDMIAMGETTNSVYGTTATMTANGLKYTFTISDVLTEFEIMVDDTISFKEVLDATKENENTTTPGTSSDNNTAYAEFQAADFGSNVTVECYVQATQTWWADRISVYAQIPGGGFFIYDMACSKEDATKLIPGTKICVSGTKSQWNGEVEILDGTFTFVDGGDTYIAEAKDVTALIGKETLIDSMNQLIAVKGAKIEKITYKNNEPGDDIYITTTVGETTLELQVEVYLTGTDSDVYKTVAGLREGDIVDIEGFLYWYSGASPHITSITLS